MKNLFKWLMWSYVIFFGELCLVTLISIFIRKADPQVVLAGNLKIIILFLTSYTVGCCIVDAAKTFVVKKLRGED